MPRPTSLHFPLRHRRTASSTTADDQPLASPRDVPLPTSPASPQSPPATPVRSKRRSLLSGAAAVLPSLTSSISGTDAASTASKAATAAAALQTRAELRAHVRNDWVFPWPATEPLPTRVTPDTVYEERALELASPNSSPSPAFATIRHPNGGKHRVAVLPVGNGPGVEAIEDPYRFADPEAVGIAVRDRHAGWERAQRMERRHNAGLRFWEDRRDAWTGAVRVRRSETGGIVRHAELEDDTEAPEADDGRWESYAPPAKRRRTAPPMPEENSDAYDQQANAVAAGELPIGDPIAIMAVADDNIRTATPDVAPPARPPSPQRPASSASTESAESASSSTSSLSSEPLPDLVTLIPRPPALIPITHPIRRQITPHAHRSIYTRIVAQSTAPSIPVNLADLVAACVAGWKADGEWPPQGAEPLRNPPQSAAPPQLLQGSGGGGGISLTAAMLGGRVAPDSSDAARPAAATGAVRRRGRRALSLVLGKGDEQDRERGLEREHAAAVADEKARVAAELRGEVVEPLDGELDTDPSDGKFGAVGRGVRRVGRVLKMVSSAVLDNEGVPVVSPRSDGEVPGLVGEDLGVLEEETEHGVKQRA